MGIRNLQKAVIRSWRFKATFVTGFCHAHGAFLLHLSPKASGQIKHYVLVLESRPCFIHSVACMDIALPRCRATFKTFHLFMHFYQTKKLMSTGYKRYNYFHETVFYVLLVIDFSCTFSVFLLSFSLIRHFQHTCWIVFLSVFFNFWFLQHVLEGYKFCIPDFVPQVLFTEAHQG